MKKILLTILFTVFTVGVFAQHEWLNPTRRKENFKDSVNHEKNVTFAKDIIIGTRSSNTVISIDSIGYVGTDAATYDGADTVNNYIPFAKRIDIGSIAVMLADSSGTGEGSYVSGLDFANAYDPRVEAFQAVGSSIKAVPIMYMADADGTQLMVDGTVYYMAFHLRKTTVLSGVYFCVQSQGAYTADDFNGIGLYSSSGGLGTLRASTANDHTILEQAVGFRSATFAVPYTAPPGYYYATFLACGSAGTYPTIYKFDAAINITMMSLDFTNSNFLSGNYAGQTGFTTPLTLSNVTPSVQCVWCFLY